MMEGYVYKQSTKKLVGKQKRYLQVIDDGSFLIYYETKPPKCVKLEDTTLQQKNS